MDTIKQFEPVFGEWYAESFIGAGSFGRVYKIYKESFGRRFYSALKYISVPADSSETVQHRLRGMDNASISAYYEATAKGVSDEIDLMYQLRGNTNIVSFEDSAILPKRDGMGYDILIRMELLTSLTNRMLNSSIYTDEVLKIGSDICSALVVCQKKGIIHRDIKPDNIFVSSSGDYKLGDFGIARQLEKTATFMSKKGTYNYMAPEVYKGEKYGASCDTYSLGIVLYRLLNNGRLSFLPPTPQPIMPDDVEAALTRRMKGEALPEPVNADPVLSAIVLKACAYDPKDRYASAEEMKTALQRYASGEHASLAGAVNADPMIGVDDDATQDVFSETPSGKDRTEGGKTVGVFSGSPIAAGGAAAANKAGNTDAPAAQPEESASDATVSARTAPVSQRKPEDKKPEANKRDNKRKKKARMMISIAAAVLLGVIGLAALLHSLNNRKPSVIDADAATAEPMETVFASMTAPAVTPTPAPTPEETELVITTAAVETEEPTGTPVPTVTSAHATPTPTPRPTETPINPPTNPPTTPPTTPPSPNPATVVVSFQDSTFELAFRNQCLNGYSGDIYLSEILDFTTLELSAQINIDGSMAYIESISDVAMFTNLKKLRIWGWWSSISDITPVSGLTKLEYLDLGGNKIQNLEALRNLKKLQTLYLSGNHFSDLSPLSGLKSLITLGLSGGFADDESSISDVRNLEPIKDLTSLEYLDLSQTSVVDLTPLARLSKLRRLRLHDTPYLSGEQVTWLQSQLTNCEIIWP